MDHLQSEYCDAWYMDDGQIVRLKIDVEHMLRVVDEESVEAGLSRGIREEVKFTLKILVLRLT